MKITAEHIINDLDLIENVLIEMAIADKDELGFSCYVYMSSKDKVGHGPRVKFAQLPDQLKTNESFSVSIAWPPKVIAGIPPNLKTENNAILWVIQNHDVLIKYWNDPTVFKTTKNFLNQLSPISMPTMAEKHLMGTFLNAMRKVRSRLSITI